ncbi:nitrilase-related carbon-nitrogen hydrolase [Labilibaculum sp.]|uniref:nitrilase-related carbon-nitrogen hydrolase n=1 Tax=Labilibaculum sp. TaxID=2060723 RepID=UPI00356A2AEE
MKVAAISSKSRIGDVNKNLSTTISWIKRLDAQGVEFILFPELNLSGYTRDVAILEKVLLAKEEVFGKLKECSKQSNAAFAVGFPDKEEEDKYFISHFVFHEGKILSSHRKTHLSANEKKTFTEGDQLPVFQVKGIGIGIQLCYETHFPELSFLQAQKGAMLLAMAFASPKESSQEKSERFQRYLPARAYDNSCYVMVCNQDTVNERGIIFPPVHFILDPKGKVAAESGSENKEVTLLELDLQLIGKIKTSKMAYFNAHKRVDWLKEQ